MRELAVGSGVNFQNFCLQYLEPNTINGLEAQRKPPTRVNKNEENKKGKKSSVKRTMREKKKRISSALEEKNRNRE